MTTLLDCCNRVGFYFLSVYPTGIGSKDSQYIPIARNMGQSAVAYEKHARRVFIDKVQELRKPRGGNTKARVDLNLGKKPVPIILGGTGERCLDNYDVILQWVNHQNTNFTFTTGRTVYCEEKKRYARMYRDQKALDSSPGGGWQPHPSGNGQTLRTIAVCVPEDFVAMPEL